MGTFVVSAMSCLKIMIVAVSAGHSGTFGFAGGTGQRDDPYRIATAAQLCSIGSDHDLLTKHYILTDDIDLDPNLPDRQVLGCALLAPDTEGSEGFQGNSFSGVFDGGGHTVRNLTIRGRAYLGLFGSIGRGGCVRNLHIESAELVGVSRVGAIAGSNSGTIEDCSGIINVRGNDNSEHIGGLAGVNEGSIVNSSAVGFVRGGKNSRAIGGLVGSIGWGTCERAYYPCVAETTAGRVLNSRVVVAVTGDEESLGIGGLAGHMWAGRVAGCYATGDVCNGGLSPGGLIGYAEAGEIVDCYATGEVCGQGGGGGLVGEIWEATVSRCYAVGRVLLGERGDYGGGLVGRRERGLVKDCFWDMDTSGIQRSHGGMGLTTAQMRDAKLYTLNGWGANSNWVLDDGRDYPRLSWEAGAGTAIPEPVIDWLPGSGTEQDPYIITTVDQLDRIGTSSVLWNRSLSLASDLNLGRRDIRMVGMRPGIHWAGNFDGNGHVIRNMTIHVLTRGCHSVGLFDRISAEGRVTDLGIENARIYGGTDSEGLAVLAGVNQGIISHCFSSSAVVTGSKDPSDHCFYLGGLVGYNEGIVSFSWSDGTVSEGTELGGLVGHNHEGATIIMCHATGGVSGGADTYGRLGGLVGANSGAVTRSYAAVEVRGDKDAGGLIGWDQGGAVIDSRAIGPVMGDNGSSFLGGLAGFVTSGSTIRRSYAEGSVSGGHDSRGIGGLVGSLNADGSVIGCYATGCVFAGDNSEGLGGLSGVGGGVIWNSYATGRILGGDNCRGIGGLVGRNPDRIVDCYAVGQVLGGDNAIGIGALVGESPVVAELPESSFFLLRSDDRGPVSGIGIGLTDTQMRQRSSFADWDFVTTWMICEGKDYPRLRWEGVDNRLIIGAATNIRSIQDE